MIPLIVFLVLGLPVFWILFRAAMLGRAMRQQGVLKKMPFMLRGGKFWTYLFDIMPEAKPRIKELLLSFLVIVGFGVLILVMIFLFSWR
jgi:hypothetical protein